jgi:hypothetical protein
MAHMFLAQRMQAPELAIGEGDAQRLSAAINEVAAHYPGLDIDPVVKSWLGLAFVAAGVYAPRVMAMRERLTTRRTKANGVNPAEAHFN